MPSYNNNYAKDDWPDVAFPDGRDLNDIGASHKDWSHGMTEPIEPGVRTVSAGLQNLGGLYNLAFAEGGSVDGVAEVLVNTRIRLRALSPFGEGDGPITIDDMGAATEGVGGHLLFRGSVTAGDLQVLAGIRAYKVTADPDSAGHLDFYSRPAGGDLTRRYRITSDGRHLYNSTADDGVNRYQFNGRMGVTDILTLKAVNAGAHVGGWMGIAGWAGDTYNFSEYDGQVRIFWGNADESVTKMLAFLTPDYLKHASSDWNGPHVVMGNWHLWIDGTGALRKKNGAPTSHNDGSLV